MFHWIFPRNVCFRSSLLVMENKTSINKWKFHFNFEWNIWFDLHQWWLGDNFRFLSPEERDRKRINNHKKIELFDECFWCTLVFFLFTISLRIIAMPRILLANAFGLKCFSVLSERLSDGWFTRCNIQFFNLPNNNVNYVQCGIFQMFIVALDQWHTVCMCICVSHTLKCPIKRFKCSSTAIENVRTELTQFMCDIVYMKQFLPFVSQFTRSVHFSHIAAALNLSGFASFSPKIDTFLFYLLCANVSNRHYIGIESIFHWHFSFILEILNQFVLNYRIALDLSLSLSRTRHTYFVQYKSFLFAPFLFSSDPKHGAASQLWIESKIAAQQSRIPSDC